MVAAVVSIGRIVMANRAALDTLVWAEDGLFPLCVRAHDPLSCLVDPFAGYLLFLPRLVAWPVSLLPLSEWPLATNIAAAVLASMGAALVVVVLRAAGTGVAASAVVALLPTLAPIMGFEAINTIGSSYMLLVFVGTLAVCFPPLERFPTWAYAIGAVVIALTIPSSALLLIPLSLQLLRHRIPARGGLVAAGALCVGLVMQGIVALTATNPRPMNWSLDSARSWADVLPSALLTFWPGQATLTAEGTFTSVAAGWPMAGLVLAGCVVIGGLGLMLARDATANGIGLLLLVGLLMGAIPATAGYANNRYFVIPVLLWSAAVFIALDRLLPWRRNAVIIAFASMACLVWWPGLRASDFRTTAVPEWPAMLNVAQAACEADPEGTVALTFSPSWPFSDAVFPGPTNNVVVCSLVTR